MLDDIRKAWLYRHMNPMDADVLGARAEERAMAVQAATDRMHHGVGRLHASGPMNNSLEARRSAVMRAMAIEEAHVQDLTELYQAVAHYRGCNSEECERIQSGWAYKLLSALGLASRPAFKEHI